MPPNLEAYFNHIFIRYDEFYAQQTAQIFLMCIRAVEPPPLLGFTIFDESSDDYSHPAQKHAKDELDLATARALQRRLTKQINRRCRDLLEVSQHMDEDPTVSFMHRTVRDFLTTTDMWVLLESRANIAQPFDPLQKLCEAYLLALQRSLFYPAHNDKHKDRRYRNSTARVLQYCRTIEEEQFRPVNGLLGDLYASTKHALFSFDGLPGYCFGPWDSDDFNWDDELFTNGRKYFLALVVQQRLPLNLRVELFLHPIHAVKRCSAMLLYYALRFDRDEKDISNPPFSADLVRVLLTHGCKSNAKLGDGRKIWHWYLKSLVDNYSTLTESLIAQHFEACKAMVSAGASIYFKWEDGDDCPLSPFEMLFGDAGARELTRLYDQYTGSKPVWKALLHSFGLG